MRNVPEVIDIFCGAGGLSYGLKSAGLSVMAGIDLDPACRFPFVRNVKAPFFEQDVAKLPSSELQSLFSKRGVSGIEWHCSEESQGLFGGLFFI